MRALIPLGCKRTDAIARTCSISAIAIAFPPHRSLHASDRYSQKIIAGKTILSSFWGQQSSRAGAAGAEAATSRPQQQERAPTQPDGTALITPAKQGVLHIIQGTGLSRGVASEALRGSDGSRGEAPARGFEPRDSSSAGIPHGQPPMQAKVGAALVGYDAQGSIRDEGSDDTDEQDRATRRSGGGGGGAPEGGGTGGGGSASADVIRSPKAPLRSGSKKHPPPLQQAGPTEAARVDLPEDAAPAPGHPPIGATLGSKRKRDAAAHSAADALYVESSNHDEQQQVQDKAGAT